MNKEVMEFSEKQEKITVCNGGKQALILTNERIETRTPEGADGSNADIEVYLYDGYWLTLDGLSVLDAVKQQMLLEIDTYDKSDKVNGFKLNGMVVWLDKATRVGLMNSTTIAKSMGSETTDLWLGDNKLTVECDKAIQLLSALEMYALECFNVTAKHKKEVSELTTIEEVEAYDIKAGYPAQLEMNV